MNYEVVIGIELECGVHRDDRHNIDMELDIRDYHCGRFIEGWLWKAERDGSLEAYREGYGTVELVSKKLDSREKIEEAYNQLKKLIKNPIEINKTMGLHHHFSVKNMNIKKITSPRFLDLLRNIFFRKIKTLEFGDKIIQQYFRRYSQKYDYERGWFEKHHDRYLEFNFKNRGRIEWRSINCLGAKTIDDIKKVSLIVYDSIIEALKRYELRIKEVVYENDYGFFKEEEIPIRCRVRNDEEIIVLRG